MKKAIVIGGSSGIGLSIVKNLIEKGYFTLILDRAEPPVEELGEADFEYRRFDLREMDIPYLESLSEDSEIQLLMITAGYGRIADFEHIHHAEIQNMMQVNTVSVLKIINIFYDRIKSDKTFYCGVMGSIAGLISSPMFSVYAASKAALCRFTESVNVELEAVGTKNRILNVSPGSIKGTAFGGGKNDSSQTAELADQIVEKLFLGEELFIPQYDETYKGVIDRYNADPKEFGKSSYEYKKNSGRADNKDGVCIGYLSGTFDLFHLGHLNLLKRAKAQCDYLVVGVHPDASHKGKQTFIPFEERKAVVAGCRYADKVVQSCYDDSDAWDLHHFHKLFVGSDYKGTERFRRYEEFFSDKGVEIVYFEYTKGTSSTQIRENILKSVYPDEKK